MRSRICLSVLVSLSTALPVLGQQLSRVRIDAPRAAELAAFFEHAGFDVVEGSVQPLSLELVATDADLERVRSMGLRPHLIEVGRPFAEIEAERRARAVEAGAEMIPQGYPDLAGIVAAMNQAASSFPAICQMVDLTARYGTPPTFEGRSLFAVKISDNVAQEEDEPAFLMVSNHHCREVVTPVIALDAIARLTQGYGNDPTITALVDDHEIWIAPTWNPDGYDYVYNVNNNWRKNRRVLPGGVGVDLNRNYPFGWFAPCAGSTSVGSSTYKGPSPASEAETQTMIAWSNDQRFAKVLDYHSSGRETLWEYNCNLHPLASYLQSEAAGLSQASGYGGRNRPPSAEGEHYEWQLATFSNHAFLTETHTSFQPSHASALAEAALVWPGTVWLLQRPIPVSGHVTDATTGAPVVASITYVENPFQNGETNSSEPRFGRYHAFLPPGTHTLRFSASCYVPQNVRVTVTAGGGVSAEVALVRAAGFVQARATSRNGSGVNPTCLTALNKPVLGSSWDLQIDSSAAPAATTVQLRAHQEFHPGLALPFGELLVQLRSPVVFVMFRPATGGLVSASLSIPANPELLGIRGTAQGILQAGATFLALCNAIDFTIGCSP